MPKHALIMDGETRVHGAPVDEPFPVAEPYRFVECPDDTTEWHTFNGTGFDAPKADARHVSGYLLLRALTDDQHDKLKGRDVARLSARGSDLIPEDSEFISRAAKAAGLKPAAWFDAALKPIA